MMGKSKVILSWSLLLVSFILIALFSLHRVVDTDIWWHLKTGEYIVKERRLITEDIFSYTALDQSGEGIELWLLPQWLSQVLLYGFYLVAGIPGLVLLKTAVLLASFAILYLTSQRSANRTVLAACLLFAAFTTHNWFSLRPYVFSLLFLTLDFYILETYRSGRKGLVYLLPFVQIVWANMHQGHVVGMVLISCYILGELLSLSRLIRSSEPMVREGYLRLLLFGGLALLGGLLSFSTPKVLLMLTGLLKGEATERPFSMIAEWVSPFSPQMEYLELSFYKLMIGISALSFALNFRRPQVSLFLTWAAFLLLSVTAHRNILFFAPLAATMAALNLAHFFNYLRARSGKVGLFEKRPWTAIEPAFQSLIILFSVGWAPQLVSNNYYIQNHTPQRFGVGISQISFPEKAIDFLLEKEIPGNIFADYDIGGYFLWRCYPQKKNYIDGRIVDPSFLLKYREIVRNPRLFDKVVQRYGINCALLSHTSPDVFGLISKLYAEDKWKLIYLDEIATVFILNTPANQPIIAQSRLEVGEAGGDPIGAPRRGGRDRSFFASLFSRVFPRRVEYPFRNLAKARLLLSLGLYGEAEREVEEALRANPDLAYSHYLLGRIDAWSGRQDAAVQQYKRALEIDPHFADAHDDLGIIYADRGWHELAIGEFKKAIRHGRRDDSAHSNLGLLYMKMGRYDEAISELEKAVRINPRHTMARGNLGDIYLGRRLFDKAIQEYELLLEADPNLLMAYLSLGAAYAAQGLYDRAVEECQKALAIDSQFAPAYYALGELHSARLGLGKAVSPAQRRGILDLAINSYEQFIKAWRGDKRQLDAARERIGRLKKLRGEQ